MHADHLSVYTKLTNEARKRKIVDREDVGPVKDLKQPKLQTAFSNANLITQARVNDKIINLFINGLLPLRLVELPEFIDLIKCLQPNRHVPTRAALRQVVVDKTRDLKQQLTALLKDQTDVATTTDCWSAYGKSYIGVTVHWIKRETLQRQSACLALRRMTGSHTFDVIAAALDDIHAEFGIRRKIVRTTTDNGSNFVKAFSVFASSNDSISNENSRADDDDDSDLSDDDTIEAIHVNQALDDALSQEYHLPRHQRCACHTLNLIATVDAEKAESNAAYKKLSRSTFAKCQGLWNKYGRSALAVEAVIDAFALGLKRPNATRWNSVFLAVERLVRVINENGEDQFHVVCSKLDVPRFTNGELEFLTEYVSSVRPLTQVCNHCNFNTYMSSGLML